MKTINTAIFLFFVIFFSPVVSFSQGNNEKLENGEILISYTGTFHGRNFEVCKEPYSNYLLGVYFDDNPKEPKDPRKYKIPVKTGGMTYVKYNNENGTIKNGDIITSSSEPGVGMKATQSGMIVGVALEDAIGESGLIKIRVQVQYVKQ